VSSREQIRECGHWVGAERRHCKEADGVRLFVVGLRCPVHTPNALKGLPEPPPGPGWPAGAQAGLSPLSTSRVHDDRAVASGKRRSSAQAYRAAQAAVRKTT
jgi:hypothetical protein